ncbi:MAG TPA: biopolymer transporter ExbD [Nitrospirota bacterium]|nr:biopolymer transporter ExbD [Nitrospirota bacterium]
MRRWTFVKNKSKIISDINITPLTDVVMVLLVIFMVTTPLMMNEALKIKLPTAATSEPQVEQTTTITVTPGNQIFLNKAQVSLDDLKGLLVSRMATSPDKTVVIKADTTIMHGTVVKILDIAKESGALKLAIATEHEKPAE